MKFELPIRFHLLFALIVAMIAYSIRDQYLGLGAEGRAYILGIVGGWLIRCFASGSRKG